MNTDATDAVFTRSKSPMSLIRDEFEAEQPLRGCRSRDLSSDVALGDLKVDVECAAPVADVGVPTSYSVPELVHNVLQAPIWDKDTQSQLEALFKPVLTASHSGRPSPDLPEDASDPHLVQRYGLPSVLPPTPCLKPRRSAGVNESDLVEPAPFNPQQASYLNMLSYNQQQSTPNEELYNKSSPVEPSNATSGLNNAVPMSPMNEYPITFPTSDGYSTQNPSSPFPGDAVDFSSLYTFANNDFVLGQDQAQMFPLSDDIHWLSHGDAASPGVSANSSAHNPGLIPDNTGSPYVEDSSSLATPATTDLHDFSTPVDTALGAGSLFPEYPNGGAVSSASTKPNRGFTHFAASSNAPSNPMRSGPADAAVNHHSSNRYPLRNALTEARAPTKPSTVSQRDTRRVSGEKRSREEAFGAESDDDDEELGVLPPNATNEERIAYKRRQNTLAARKSRKRKANYRKNLEDNIESLEDKVKMWRARTVTLLQAYHASGEPLPNWAHEVEF